MGVSATSSGDDSLLKQASVAERDATNRIASANERVQNAQKDASDNLNHVQDDYEKQYVRLSSRQETALEAQKLKSYETIRDSQRRSEAEIRKTRRSGEAEISHQNEHYRDAIIKAEGHGREELKSLLTQQAHLTEYETKTGNEQTKELQEENMHNLTKLREDGENKALRLTEENKTYFEKLRDESAEANLRVKEKYDNRYKNTVAEGSALIEQVENRGSKQLREIRRDTASKLDAYRTRQGDPFYKLVDLNAHLKETKEAFILTVTIPEYEQQHLSTLVQGDNLVISGNRHNQEKLEIEPGHSKASAIYQSFTESFPLDWPVDAKRLTRVSEGDQVIITVPKKNEFAFRNPEKEPPPKVRVEPPQFPENIRRTPHVRDFDDPDNYPAPKSPGSGTLS
jgi:HSP20 family molecular chaperone IbpA